LWVCVVFYIISSSGYGDFNSLRIAITRDRRAEIDLRNALRVDGREFHGENERHLI
jgi:hypothetical protein